MIFSSEGTMRSAAPQPPDAPDGAEDALVLAGGTLVELHPLRIGTADLLVRGPRIAQVGGTMPEGLPRHDVSGCLVMPAFAVAHTHTYMTLATGMPPPAATPRTLTDHLQWIWWALDKALDEDLVEIGALVAAAQAARAGTACLVDLHSSPRAIDGALDRIAAAFDEVGIRGVLAFETSDREGRARRDASLRENRRFLRRVALGQTAHRALVGAHAPMSLNDDTLDALKSLADEHAVGLHLHVAEDASDALDAQRNKRTTLERRLARLGLGRPGSVVAHANELAPETRDSLLEAGTYVVTSPRSNMRHGLRPFDGAGERVAFGTDGVDGDVLEEARLYGHRHDEARDGLGREVGMRIRAGQRLVSQLFGEPEPCLAPGARADLVVLAYDPPTPLGPSNVLDHLRAGWSQRSVRDTIVGGRFVLRDRVLVTVDERALLVRARTAASRLWERMQGYYG